MARRSIYEFEAKSIVSIWVATAPRSSIPDDYFEAHYDRGDNEPCSRFAEDFGFGFYDHDFVDTNGCAVQPKPIERLLGECSYGASYLAEGVATARRQKLDRTEFVFLLYDIEYRPEVTGVSRSEVLAFLGSFRYDPGSTSAFPLDG